MEKFLNLSQLIILSGLLLVNTISAQTPLTDIEPVDPLLLEQLDAPHSSNKENVHDEVTEIAEPEPTFEALLTPNIQQPVELKTLNTNIESRKHGLKEMENTLERLNTKQHVFSVRQEKITLRKEMLNTRQERLDLKRSDVEAQLADSIITSKKRARLEVKLARITSREVKINEKLQKIEARSNKLDEKLVRLQKRLVDLGEAPHEDVDLDELELQAIRSGDL